MATGIKIGDRVVVNGLSQKAYVENIVEDHDTASTIIFLDWKEFGKSKVYMHDLNKSWYKYSEAN
jgi:hypothetical protein